MVCSPFEKIIRFSSLDVLGALHVRAKVFKKKKFVHIFHPKGKNPNDRVPLI